MLRGGKKAQQSEGYITSPFNRPWRDKDVVQTFQSTLEALTNLLHHPKTAKSTQFRDRLGFFQDAIFQSNSVLNTPPPPLFRSELFITLYTHLHLQSCQSINHAKVVHSII